MPKTQIYALVEKELEKALTSIAFPVAAREVLTEIKKQASGSWGWSSTNVGKVLDQRMLEVMGTGSAVVIDMTTSHDEKGKESEKGSVAWSTETLRGWKEKHEGRIKRIQEARVLARELMSECLVDGGTASGLQEKMDEKEGFVLLD